MTESLDQFNPYQAPTSGHSPSLEMNQVEQQPASVAAWVLVYSLNLPVPFFFGIVVTDGTGKFGMVLAVVVLLAAGVFATRRYPRTLTAISIGGLVTALSQFYPMLQMFAGMAALFVTEALSLSDSGAVGAGGFENVGTVLGGFCATCITAFIEIIVAAMVGGLVQLARRQTKKFPGEDL